MEEGLKATSPSLLNCYWQIHKEGSCYRQLCTHWWCHHVPIHSSNLVVTQMALVKLNGSLNKANSWIWGNDWVVGRRGVCSWKGGRQEMAGVRVVIRARPWLKRKCNKEKERRGEMEEGKLRCKTEKKPESMLRQTHWDLKDCIEHCLLPRNNGMPPLCLP